MFSVLKFILNCIVSFMNMLFHVQVDNGLSLGLLMCICFILFPMMLRIINFLKRDALEELDDRIDESRPMHTHTDSYSKRVKFNDGYTYSYTDTYSRRRRHKR